MNSDETDILLVDDSQDDVDLTLHALRAENLANHVFIARDGEEALDFLFCSGPHSQRNAGSRAGQKRSPYQDDPHRIDDLFAGRAGHGERLQPWC